MSKASSGHDSPYRQLPFAVAHRTAHPVGTQMNALYREARLSRCKSGSHGSTLIKVRGLVAILLVGLFSISLISPALFALDADSNLPACCRRSGNHHCAMMTSRPEASSGPSMQAGRCPYFPVAKAVPANRTVSLPGFFQAVFAELLSHPASRPQTEALCRISYSRTGQKRGPPPFTS
jgi:hypothetical protein